MTSTLFLIKNMSNLHYSLLLGASACVQLSQFEEAITWCEKGLAVSFIVEATTKNIVQIQTLYEPIPAIVHKINTD